MPREPEFYAVNGVDYSSVQRRTPDGRLEEVATASPFIDGAAEQIARALNRLPEAEQLLIQAAQALRSGDEKRVNDMADVIEDWMVGDD